MKLRWLVQRNSITAAEVDSYSRVEYCTRYEAKKKLANEKAPVLQYWVHVEGMEEYPDAGSWINVPTETEPSPLD